VAAGGGGDPAAHFMPAQVVRRSGAGDTLTAIGFDYDWFLHDAEPGRPRPGPVPEHRQQVVTRSFEQRGGVPNGPRGATRGARARGSKPSARPTSGAHSQEMAENTHAGPLRPRESLCYNRMSCAHVIHSDIDIFGGLHAAAPAPAR
jgi:hypothetical protein